MNLGLYSYLGAAIAYGFFALLLLFSWRCSLQGKLLTLTAVSSAVWAILAARIASNATDLGGAYVALSLIHI